MKIDILKRLSSSRVVILDGSMGALLIGKGITPSGPVGRLNIENPDVIEAVHEDYIESGAEIILTNTFETNPNHYKKGEFEEVIFAGIEIARRAARGKVYVAGDIGPLGVLVEPLGDFPYDEAYRIFCKIGDAFAQDLPDLIWIESFTSMVEARAAFLALRELNRPIVITGAFQKDGRTSCGDIPEAWAVTFQRLGAVAVGVNCTEPATAVEIVRRMRSVTNLPLVAKPNAGLPRIRQKKTVYTLNSPALANYFDQFIDAGATMVGGCCGSTPEYIRLISRRQRRVSKIVKDPGVFISSSREVINLSTSAPTLIVGERLNPSGRKSLRAAIEKDNFEIFGNEAREQEEAGADALDVNAFNPNVDEKRSLRKAVFEVYKKSSLPIFIDTQNFQAAEEVLKFWPGIPVLNSVPARIRELKGWLPMIKKYGARVVISLVGE
ncbi:MAG: homocysteine S-methyltransferase family protein, partial [candidate division WOR-3 bacterium]